MVYGRAIMKSSAIIFIAGDMQEISTPESKDDIDNAESRFPDGQPVLRLARSSPAAPALSAMVRVIRRSLPHAPCHCVFNTAVTLQTLTGIIEALNSFP